VAAGRTRYIDGGAAAGRRRSATGGIVTAGQWRRVRGGEMVAAGL